MDEWDSLLHNVFTDKGINTGQQCLYE